MPRDWVEDCDMGRQLPRSHSRSRCMRAKGKGVHVAVVCVDVTQVAPRRSTKLVRSALVPPLPQRPTYRMASILPIKENRTMALVN